MVGTEVWSSPSSAIPCTVLLGRAPAGLWSSPGSLCSARELHRCLSCQCQGAQSKEHRTPSITFRTEHWVMAGQALSVSENQDQGYPLLHLAGHGFSRFERRASSCLHPTEPSHQEPTAVIFHLTLSLLFIVRVRVFSLHVYLYTMHIQCPQMPEEGIGSSGTRIVDNCELPCEGWKSILRPKIRPCL